MRLLRHNWKRRNSRRARLPLRLADMLNIITMTLRIANTKLDVRKAPRHSLRLGMLIAKCLDMPLDLIIFRCSTFGPRVCRLIESSNKPL